MHPEYKICRVCGETKPLGDFYSGINACKPCKITENRRYAVANIERTREKNRNWARGWRTVNRDTALVRGVNNYARRKGAPGQITEAEYHQVFARCGHRCRACGAADRLTIDHVVSMTDGGPNRPENMQVLCMPCNTRKGVQEREARKLKRGIRANDF